MEDARIREIALFHAALVAAVEEPSNPQRRMDLLNGVTQLTDAYRADGLHVDTVVNQLRNLLRRRERFSVFEDDVIQHAIVQYHR